MVGSLFAGREESPGDVVRRRGRLFKVYRGMASRSAAAARLAIEGRGDALDQYVAEGEEMEFPLRGSVAEIVEELHGGLRSGMSYVDAATIPAVLGEGELHPADRGRRARVAPGQRMTTLYRNGVIVTMDDAGSEHEDGWLLVDGSTIAAVGRGAEPAADDDGRPERRRRHARASSTRTTTSTRPSHARGRRRPTSSRGFASCIRSGRGSTQRRSMPPRAPASRSSRSRVARPFSTTTTCSRRAARA